MKIENLSLGFGDQQIMDGFSLDVKPGTITCLLGPSGCGKTTLLNIVASLRKPEAGTIIFDDSEKGSISFLFQEPRLFPWRTALENLTIALGGDAETAERYLSLVGLKDAMNKYPGEMSGGMRQRIAMARAFSYSSGLLLMDEPFQSLDTELRSNLLKVFLGMWRESRQTVLWVTHDIMEACLAADNVICLSKSPMRIVHTEIIGSDRESRNAGNCAPTAAKLYGYMSGGIL